MSFDFSDLAGVGVNAATGNYVGAAVSAVGLGMSIFGGLSGASASSQMAQVSADEAVQEQGINNAKQAAMELNARRTTLENFRNGQRARANAIAGATSGNAQFGSGLAGGEAQITDQTTFNNDGVFSALQTGRQINQFNQNISNDKVQMANLGGQAATDAGWTSLGGSIMKSGPLVGQFAQGFGSSRSGGNYSGTPGASNTGGLY